MRASSRAAVPNRCHAVDHTLLAGQASFGVFDTRLLPPCGGGCLNCPGVACGAALRPFWCGSPQLPRGGMRVCPWVGGEVGNWAPFTLFFVGGLAAGPLPGAVRGTAACAAGAAPTAAWLVARGSPLVFWCGSPQLPLGGMRVGPWVGWGGGQLGAPHPVHRGARPGLSQLPFWHAGHPCVVRGGLLGPLHFGRG